MRSLHQLTPTGILVRRIGRALKRGLVMHTFYDRIRFACCVMIILGPIFGVVEWHNRQRTADILARGVAAEATVSNSKVTSGRSTTYSIDLAWRDAQGAQQRVEQMTVSAGFFGWLTRTNPPPKILIKHLADRETSRRTVVLLDDIIWKPNPNNMLPAWTVPSLMGAIGLALLTLWRTWRRRRRAQLA
jgi:hypothetical protein